MQPVRRHAAPATVAATLMLGAMCSAQAATFSTTAAELLYGFDYERESEEGAILTLKNYTAFTYGDSYFFLDVGNVDDRDDTDGIHLEWGPRLSPLRAFGGEPWEEGLIRDVYVIGQLDIDGNQFTNKAPPWPVRVWI